MALAPVSRETVIGMLPQFVGQVQQLPPIFSALKVNGRRAYALARAGQEVVLQPRTVSIYDLELLEYEWPALRLRIDCGRGTYIRSIARDIGEALGVGGYLTQLCRTRVGPCRIEAAITLDQLALEGLERHLMPPETVTVGERKDVPEVHNPVGPGI